MADNTELAAGSGGDVISTDDIGGGVKVQRVKVQYGVDGSATDVSDTNPMPIDDAGGSITVDDGGTSLTVDGTVSVTGVSTAANQSTANGLLTTIDADTGNIATAASAIQTAVQVMDDWDEANRAAVNTIAGQVGVQGASGVVTALTQRVVLATDVALPTGSNTIGAVNLGSADSTKLSAIQTAVELIDNAISGSEMQVDIVGAITPGTAATNLGKAEDAPHASGDVGMLALAVRRDTAAVGTDLDGDNATLNVDGSGRLWSHDPVTAALLTTIDADTGNVATSTASIATAVQIMDDWDESDRCKTNPIVGQAGVAAGAGAVGATVQRMTLASDDPAVALLGTIDADTSTLAGAVSGTEMQVDVVAPLPAGTNAIGTVTAVGAVAHDAAVSGNPVRVAARAQTADFAAVATGDTVDLLATILGKQVVMPYSLPGNTWQYAAGSGGITNTTGVTAKAAAGAGIINYITHVSVVNAHATVGTDVQIRDGASGTVLWRSYAVAPGGGVSEKFDPPLKGTANTLVEVANGTTGAATYFNLQGYVAAE